MAAPQAALGQEPLGGAAGGFDAITLAAAGFLTVVLVVLYARQIKRTAEAERSLAVEREAARAAEAALPARLAERERAILEAVAVPVWRREAGGGLGFGNAAAQPLFPELEKAAALAERAVHIGRSQSESRNMVIRGDRRLIDVTESPAATGGTVGTARAMAGRNCSQQHAGHAAGGGS